MSGVPAGECDGRAVGKELYIFHTNDMHSRIEPFASYFPDTVLAGKAGVLRRAAFVKEQRREHKDMLLFDSGDFLKEVPIIICLRERWKSR